MEKLDEEVDEALEEEGDLGDEAVTEIVQRCQEVLMLLEVSWFNMENFGEEVEQRKEMTIPQKQHGATINVVPNTCEQEQRDVAVVER